MYGVQNGRQTRTFSSHLEHFPFEVFKVSLFFSSLLGIQVVASLVLSRSLTPRVLAQWCRVLAVGGSSQHLLLLPLSWLLTVGRSIIQEVGCHFAFTFYLYDPTTLKHVPFAYKHLVEVCGHL